MKLQDILKIMAVEFGTKSAAELNDILKAKATPVVKFKITGKKIGHLGFTGAIKAISDDGLKVFSVNKVTLVRYVDIEKFEKAKPKVERPERPKKEAAAKKEKIQKIDEENGFEKDFLKPEKYRLKKRPAKGKSSFIPSKK